MPRDLTSIAVKTENCNISICQVVTRLFMGIKPLGHMIPHVWCPLVWKPMDALLTHQGFWIKTNPHRKKQHNLYQIKKHTTGCKAQLVIPRSSQLNQLISQPTAYHSGLGQCCDQRLTCFQVNPKNNSLTIQRSQDGAGRFIVWQAALQLMDGNGRYSYLTVLPTYPLNPPLDPPWTPPGPPWTPPGPPLVSLTEFNAV